jgi:TonB family protein
MSMKVRLRGAPFAIAMLAAPVPLFGQVAQPVEDPGRWISNSDYPVSSLRALEEGRVEFRITVGRSGAPTNCLITASSGSASLDKKTCNVMMDRAKFAPPVDENNAPAIGYYSAAVAWILPFPHEIDFSKNYVGLIGEDKRRKMGNLVTVRAVMPGPGQNAGIQKGDVITHVNDQPVSQFVDFAKLVGTIPAGSTYTISIERNGAPLRLTVGAQPFPPEGTKDHLIIKQLMWYAYFGD